MYLQIQVSRIKGDDPLDMVSLILKEGRSKTKFKFLQTKTRPNHSLSVLSKFLKILENTAFAFITSHNRFLTTSISSSLAVYFSTNGFRAVSQIPSGSEHLIPNFGSELGQGARRIEGPPIPGYNYNARCAYYSINPGHGVKDGRPLKRAIKDLIMTLKSEKTTTMKSRQLSHDNKVTTTESRQLSHDNGITTTESR